MSSKLSHEEKLQFSELRYRRLFETAQDGILILDAVSGKIDDANPFLQKLLSYTESELLGKQLWEIGVFKDIIDSKEAFMELQNKGYIRYRDLPLQTKDGRKVDVEFVSNVYMVGSQKVIQCNIRDISERKKAEEAEKETKKAMLNVMEDLEEAKAVIETEKVKDEAILASVGDGMIATDQDARVIFMNQANENLIGWKKEEIVGKLWFKVVPMVDEKGNAIPDDQRPIKQAISNRKTTTTTFNSYYFIRRDKTKFPVAITATPIILNKKVIGAIGIYRDITYEKEVDKAKSEFVSLASHQLRTPLGIIKWYLEALRNEDYFKKIPLNIQEYFDEINKSNERVLSLVRDLLSVSRIEQGRVKNITTSVDIIQTVREIVEQMQIAARKKKVALSLTIQDRNIPPVGIDMLRLHEVIENLIGNAIEYTMALGKVAVTITKQGDAIVISVADTGIGISAVDQKKLFTKFFRTAKAVEYNPVGSGLGLYVVKSYVEGWGGKVSVESKEGKPARNATHSVAGGGSTFTISLPISRK